MIKKLLSLLILILITQFAIAQCADGEVTLELYLYTDNWGEENYWELVPGTNSCGDQTIDFGANVNVGCAGTAPNDGADGYPDNALTQVGPYCLTVGETYSIIFVDSYGDGGMVFELYENGNLSNVYFGSGSGNTWTFQAGVSTLPIYDSPCGAIEMTANGAVVEFDNTNAVAGFAEINPIGGPCNLSGAWCNDDANATNSVWAYFTAEEGISYEITTCNSEGSFDTQLALYHSSDCSDFSAYELIASNDDMQGGCDLTNLYASKMYASCLIPGDTYYIQIDGWQGSTGITNLSISTYEGETSFDAFFNDVPCPLDKGTNPDGSILPYINGSGANFTSEWTGPNGYTSSENFITGLAPGTYNVVVTSSCGEVFEGSYTLSLPEPWAVVLNADPPTCQSSGDGSFSPSVSGATLPYTYQWTGPDNYNSSSPSINNIDAGLYVVVITDANGCAFTQNLELDPAGDFSFDLGADTLICLNQQIVINAPTGLNYLWQDGSSNSFFEIMAADWGLGTHALVLTGSTDDGCSYTDAFVFSVENCIGVQENEATRLSIYPNPAASQVRFSLPQFETNVHIIIRDALGKTVYDTSSLKGKDFDVQFDLPIGLYQFEINLPTEKLSTRLIVEQ
jgi:hypothetical protein